MKSILDNKEFFKYIKKQSKTSVVILDITYKQHQLYEVEPGITIIDFLQKKFPNGFDFVPAFFKNEEEISIENLDTVIELGDTISIFSKPQIAFAVSFVVSIVVNVVVSYVLKLLFPAQKTKEAAGYNYSSLYSSSVKQIEAKKNGPIPYISGVVRMYPQLIAPEYTVYSLRMPNLNSIRNDNGEDTYLLCCLGSGQIDVLQLYINNTQVEAL